MKRYEEYKDSGISWIGEIPKDWMVVRLKHIFRRERNAIKVGPFGSQIKGEDFIDEGYKVYNQRTVLDNDFESGEAFVNEKKYKDLIGFKLNPHDVLITTRGTIGKIAIAPEGIDEGIIHPCIIKFSVDYNRIDKRILKYIFNDTPITSEQLILASNATTIAVVYSDPLKNVYFALPSLPEQQKIGDSLDAKTVAIDTLIADKQKLIDLLKEKRQAIISEAVTKGLDKNAKMKDSGIEWIGEIPEGWEVKKLKFLGKAIIGLTYAPEEITYNNEKGTLVFRSSNVQNGSIVYDDNVYVDKDIPYNLRTVEGDILICSRNGSRDLIGKNAIIGAEDAGKSFGAFMTIFRSQYNSFIYYIFNSIMFKYLSGSFLTSTVNQLTTGNLNNMIVPFPPREVQREIVVHLNAETIRIDALVADIQTQIEKLQEYRQSVISEAVTGKVAI